MTGIRIAVVMALIGLGCSAHAQGHSCGTIIDTGVAEAITLRSERAQDRVAEALDPAARRSVRIDTYDRVIRIWPKASDECPLRPIAVTESELNSARMFFAAVRPRIDEDAADKLRSRGIPVARAESGETMALYTFPHPGEGAPPLDGSSILARFDWLAAKIKKRVEFADSLKDKIRFPIETRAPSGHLN